MRYPFTFLVFFTDQGILIVVARNVNCFGIYFHLNVECQGSLDMDDPQSPLCLNG